MRRTYKRMVSAVLVLVLVAGLLPSSVLVSYAGAGSTGAYTPPRSVTNTTLPGMTSTPGWEAKEEIHGWELSVQLTNQLTGTDNTEALAKELLDVPKYMRDGQWNRAVFVLPTASLRHHGSKGASRYKGEGQFTTSGDGYTVRFGRYSYSEMCYYLYNDSSANYASAMSSVMNNIDTVVAPAVTGVIDRTKTVSLSAIVTSSGSAISIIQGLACMPTNRVATKTDILRPSNTFKNFMSSIGDKQIPSAAGGTTSLAADVRRMSAQFATAYAVDMMTGGYLAKDLDVAFNNYLTGQPFRVPMISIAPNLPSWYGGGDIGAGSLNGYSYCVVYGDNIPSVAPGASIDERCSKRDAMSGTNRNLWGPKGNKNGEAIPIAYMTVNSASSIAKAVSVISSKTDSGVKATDAGSTDRQLSVNGQSYKTSAGYYYLYCCESYTPVTRVITVSGGYGAGDPRRFIYLDFGIVNKTESQSLEEPSVSGDVTLMGFLNFDSSAYLDADQKLHGQSRHGIAASNEKASYTIMKYMRDVIEYEASCASRASFDSFVNEAAAAGNDVSELRSMQSALAGAEFNYDDFRLSFICWPRFKSAVTLPESENAGTIREVTDGYSGAGDTQTATWRYNYPFAYSYLTSLEGAYGESIVRGHNVGADGKKSTEIDCAQQFGQSMVAALDAIAGTSVARLDNVDGCAVSISVPTFEQFKALYTALEARSENDRCIEWEFNVPRQYAMEEGYTYSDWGYIGGGMDRPSPDKQRLAPYKYKVLDAYYEVPDGEGGVRRVEFQGVSTLWALDSINTISFMDHKTDYNMNVYVNPEWPTFHSTYDPYPHSEFNQGTVNAGATSPTRKFNSMTGTPTFTATERSELIDSVENTGYYGKDGHYYQYYAAGGTEFVVEFDGKFYKNQTATRQFTVEVQTSGACSESGPPCPGESAYHEHWTTVGDPPTPVLVFAGMTHDDGCCGAPLHTAPHAHYQHGIWTGSITYPGLSYVEIENVKVYKLSEARLDGTYALLEQDEVYATVQAMAPGLSMNIAGANTAKAGRMVYDWIPDGNTGAGGSDPDHLYWGAKTCTSTCGEDGQDLEDYINQCLGPGHTGAWCLSDFIVIHTSAGTQSVLYHEYHSINDGALLISCSGSSGGPCVGTSEASASVELYQGTEFEVKEYEEVWKNNPWTSEGASWEAGGQLTYGGFNGQPMNLSTTYKSTVPATTNINMSWGSWTGTQAYQNKSKVFGARGENSFLQKNEPSKTFRLMRDQLIIPDYKQNGDYSFTASQVFYELIAYKDSGDPKHVDIYSPAAVGEFGGRRGMSLDAGYSNDSSYKTVANSIVVYNPVSNQNAIVISLPEERDQRVDPPDIVQPGLNSGCPGATCEFSELDCTETTHLHNSSCYTINSYTVHSANNVHVHTWTDPETGQVFECPKTGGNMCAGQPCMATGTHRSAYCPYGHSCNGCSTCHVCQSNGAGGYYITHPSGCTYAGQTHYSTSYPYCTQCSHSCGGSYTLAEHYTCGNLPLNAHQCDSSKFVYLCDGANNKHVHDENCPMTAEKTTTYQNFYYQATGTDLFSFVAPADGTVEFCSTSYTADPRGRIYVNGVCVVDNDDGGNGLNFHATASVRKGDRVVLNAYQYGSAGAGTISGWYKTPGGYECGNTPNYHEHDVSCPKRPECYETSVVNFMCSNPHHTWDTDWHVYTTGRMHKDGTVCKGQGCTNMSDIQIRNGEYVSVSVLSGGMLVRHTDGQVHLTRQGTTKCDMCGKNFAFYANATQTTRVLSQDEIDAECGHYPMGDARCWKPCGDPDKHNEVRNSVVDMDGNEIVQGDFINLDYGFTIYFPNNGDFYQTGRQSCLEISTERGWGYVNNMDTTEWIAKKWVVFPFDVTFKGISYQAYTKIFLPVPDVYFDFYCVMENNEMASAEVVFGTTAINAIIKDEIAESMFNESTNKRIVPMYSRPHDSNKRFYIDVVGRIGALTMNDVGDFRYSNFFKQTIDGWLVPNVIRRVDTSKQLNIVMDDTDIRGIDIDDALIHQGTSESKALNGYSTGSHIGNTYGIREERLRNIWEHPLVPSYLKSSADGAHGSEPGYYRDDGTFVPTPNNQSALCKQPVRIGYDAYMDFSTIGNYYGRHRTSNGDDLIVRPHYFRLRWDNANAYLTPADVYRLDDGVYTLVNDFDSDGGVPLTNKTQVSLNWVEECARRNYDAVEQRKTEFVHSSFGIDMPRGSQFVYGTYNLMSLWDRNRTSIGTPYTYGVNTDPSGVFSTERYDLQGARWHFNLGLPSSSVFVASGERPTDENIKNFAGEDGQAVIVCALEIYARGDVWNLIYDGKDINSPFKITPDGPEFNPNTWNTPTFKYPGREEDLVIAEIISINHSSKEDVTTSGTH